MSLINKTDASRFSFVRAFRNWRGGASENPTLYQKSETGLWYETINPLRGLTVDKAAMIFDRARLGVYAELQYLYNEIEAADPTLFVCTERREAAAGSCEWRIARSNPERVAAYDEALADDQSAYLYAAYGNAADEIGALAEHLSRAFFRGFAHARAIISADGVEGFEFFDNWNFARDPSTGDWWWNPDAVSWANDNFRPIPPGELISLTRSRHIDYPSLFVFIRAALGDRQWGVFLERFGIPPVTIIMPEFADKSEESAYMSAAQKLAAAGSGALPFGSEVSYASDSRSVNPFLDFLRRQQELTVLMATGGLLTTLTAPGSGTLAGEAHLDTWREVVRRDIRSVSRAINRSLTSRLLSARFPGQPHLAYLEFDADPAPSADQIFETAAKARAAGYLVERSELSDRTGYKLDLDDTGIDPFAGPTTWRTSLPKPEEIAAIGDQVNNKQGETLKNIIASHCKTHGSKITNKDSAETATALERILAPISGISADPIKAALDVIENGGSEDEALAAYDQVAAAVLTPEKIAAAAEEIARIIDDAVAKETV